MIVGKWLTFIVAACRLICICLLSDRVRQLEFEVGGFLLNLGRWKKHELHPSW